MSWTIQTHNMKAIRSFARAAQVWETAEPFPKTVHTSWKPLDGRRQQHKRIVRLSDERGYDCVLHNTIIVSYRSDGSVTLGCHSTRSTRTFAHVVAPEGCRPLSVAGAMFWEVETDHGPRYYREGSRSLLLRPTASGHWALETEPAIVQEWAYDCVLGGQVLHKLRPYKAWLSAVRRLDGNSHTDSLTRNHPMIKHLLDNHDKVEEFPYIAERLGLPSDLNKLALTAAGARYRALAPSDRLPRSLA